MTVCNHEDSKRHTYVFKLGPVAEVYMCECGALVNIAHPDNYGDADGEVRAMTPGELDAVIAELLSEQRAALIKKLSSLLEKIK